MKKFLFIFAVLVSAVSAQASIAALPHAAICELNQENENPVDIKGVRKIDIKTATKVPAYVVSFINQHLQKEQYTTSDLTFDQIKQLFAKTGEQGYNDLYVTYYREKSGVVYTEVKSFPGENAYAMYFDAAGNVVARMADGDIELVIGSETVFCNSIAE